MVQLPPCLFVWFVGRSSLTDYCSFLPFVHFSCADYVKHLVKVTKEKEAAVRQAKCDLEAKRSKEGGGPQDPSDPESTTSSLTVSSDSATCAPNTASVSEVKRLASQGMDEPKAKKRCLQSHVSSLSSSASSGGDDSGNPLAHSVNMDQTVSTVSDITESIKESSSSSDASLGRRSSRRGSISSEAAVAAEREKNGAEKQCDHVSARKREALLPLQLAPLSPDFEIDYQEVFVKSHVPQCLASTAGKIVSWNESFIKSTGIPEKRMESTTIFSLVQTGKLSNLFEIVAKSLRSAEPLTLEKRKEDTNYESLTLPCIKFPSDGSSQLHITVS